MLLRAAPAPAAVPHEFRPPSPPYSPPQRGSGAEGARGHAWSVTQATTAPWRRPSYGATSPAELAELAQRLDKLPKYEALPAVKVCPCRSNCRQQ